MNRKIKFRLIQNHQIVGYERFNPKGGLNCWEYSLDNVSWSNLKILHTEKNRFTGLKDRNVKEIYEKDIIKEGQYIDKPLVVVWNNGTCSYDLRDEIENWGTSEHLLDLSGESDLGYNPWEIIGNVYENKELLKMDKKLKSRAWSILKRLTIFVVLPLWIIYFSIIAITLILIQLISWIFTGQPNVLLDILDPLRLIDKYFDWARGIEI